MLGYRRRSFQKAHNFLSQLRKCPGNLDILIELQKLLLGEIIRAEDKIRSHKQELASSLAMVDPKDASMKRNSVLTRRIEGYRHVNYIWRCFGDAIAFLYLDKFALKQTYFHTENPNPKQDAGFIVGKEGLGAEIAFLEDAVAAGIPSLLVDLTNTIRHGDVCLLEGPDPYLIEVKAGHRPNKRGRKQAQGIRKIHEFFENDVVENLRGFQRVERHSFESEEVTYEKAINTCIGNAVSYGEAHVTPEHGLHYIALTERPKRLGDIFQKLDMKQPHVFFLNDFKSHRDWSPFLPFTLSIHSSEHLYEFVRGKLVLVIILDVQMLDDLAKKMGFSVTCDLQDKSYPLKLSMPKSEYPILVGAHMLRRIWLEFCSPEWIVGAAIEVSDCVTDKSAQ